MTDLAVSSVLNETDHGHFLEHGYVLLRGLVPTSVLDAAVASLEASDKAADAAAFKTQLFYDDLPEVKACFPFDVLARAATELAGPGCALKSPETMVYIPRPYTETRPPGLRWHIDLVYPMLTPDAWAINTFVFLTRVRTGGGAFKFSPGAPRRVRAEMLRNSVGFTFRPDGTERDQDSVPKVEFLAEPGDVLLYSYLLSHTASSNHADPQTRHAFGGGIWVPLPRLELGDKPVEQMSTLEKASSTAYARQVDPTLPDFSPAADAPRGPRTSRRLLAHVTLRFDGRIHVFLVEQARAGVVRHVSTTDWAAWQEHGLLELEESARVLRLATEHSPELSLLVSVQDPEGGVRVRRFSAVEGVETWQEGAPTEGVLVAERSFAQTTYGSKAAQGTTEFSVPGDGSRLEWHSTGDWDGVARDGVAVRAPEGARIVDLQLKPSLPLQHCLVTEVEYGGGRREVLFSLSPTTDEFTEPLRPLPVSGGPIRNLRLHERGRGYWLVSYLADAGSGDELRWGTIDWEGDGTLRPIDSSDALRDALGIVGLV
jgi:hypothetical protein